MAPRVRLHAYMQQNLGDDLLVRMLCERFSDVEFHAECNERSATAFSALGNFRRMSRLPRRLDAALAKMRIPLHVDRWFAARALRRCVAVVNIGGSIFIQGDDWRARMAARRARFASGKPSFVIGANFGPYSDDDFLREMRDVLKGSRDLCLRDRYSVDLLDDLGNVRYAPDVVLSLPPIECEAGKTAVISVIDLESRPDLRAHSTAYTAALVEMVEACNRAGLEVVLMGFCEYERDGDATRRVLDALGGAGGSARVRAYSYRGDVDEALLLIASASLVVATRFHAMILAWAFGVPVLPVSYSEKTAQVIQDMAFPGPWVRLEELESLSVGEVVADVLSSEPFEVTEPLGADGGPFAALERFLANEA